MVQQGHSPGSEFRQIEEALTQHRPVAQSRGEAARYCAYNETRERFLSADVEVADFSAASLDASADATSQPPPVPATSSPPETSEPARKATKASQSWWRRLWNPDPSEPRMASRESQPWLIAYFFTGGAPVAHPVRDVSLAGLYVVTDEQWYLGTIVRITLTDQREQTVDRSFTLNAKVVRRGNDGTGLLFLLDDEKEVRSKQTPSLEDDVERVSKHQLKRFLRRLNESEA
jgi:hypothetical protein